MNRRVGAALAIRSEVEAIHRALEGCAVPTGVPRALKELGLVAERLEAPVGIRRYAAGGEFSERLSVRLDEIAALLRVVSELRDVSAVQEMLEEASEQVALAAEELKS